MCKTKFIRNLLVASLWINLVSSLHSQQRASIVLNDVTRETGIDFVHSDGSTGQFFLVESMSAGLAVIDFDSDGDLDIYFLNGAPIQATPDQPPKSNALYRNDGNWKFTNVTKAAKVGDSHLGLGIACADYDNDGFIDIYLNNYGENILYRNNGDGTYLEVTDFAAVGNGQRVGGGASFFDMDRDGDLDLYVGNYVRFDIADHRVHMHKGLPSYPSPLSFQPDPDSLFENLGDGTFRDISTQSGIDACAGRSMGLVTFDYDDDGDIDVYVANDTQENFLFVNDGQGHFDEVALLAGLALDFKGNAQASMGVELVDLDQDGRLDLFVTSFAEEFATYYRNLGNGSFEDATLRAGASEATFPHVTWGVAAADFDNNSTPDLIIATGHLDPLHEKRVGASSTTSFRVPDMLLQNMGQGRLVDAGKDWGSGALVAESTRGLISCDLDSDGKQDVVALNSNSPPTLLKNESPSGSFVRIQLIGVDSNRDALGSKVEIEQLGKKQVAQLRSGHSYQCEGHHFLHFGLQSSEAIVNANIRWPSGQTTHLQLRPSQFAIIVESR